MWSAGWNAKLRHALDLQGFQFQTVLHEGALSDVYECTMGVKKVHVAVKAPGEGLFNHREVAAVKEIAQCNLDQYNIVKCYGDIQMYSKERLLVFEKLDINLERYISDVQSNKPLPLSCIRDVAKQMSVALTALSSRSIIHADIKPSNIMIVKQHETPFTFKLIDFGSALWAQEASQCFLPLSGVGFKSPEIMLGLPFAPSTDVWSLGCVLTNMFLGRSLFDTESELNTFRAIHQLIGRPAEELLDQGMYTSRFYDKIDGKWVLKSAEKTEENMFSSLDDLKPLSVGVYRRHDPTEREQCVELLKKMLQVNPEDRITLEEITKHPFITKRYPPKVTKLTCFIPFQKKTQNQQSQRPTNALPSEKPKVSNVKRVKNIFSDLKRNKIHPQETQNQPSQRPTNALPSEKPKVSNVQRAKNIFSNLKRNKIHPLSGEQTPCAQTKPEQKAQPRKLTPGLLPAGRPGVSTIKPASEIPKKDIPRNKCPKTNSSTVSANDAGPSLSRILMVKPAPRENRTSLSDGAEAPVVTNNSAAREGKRPVSDDGGSQSQTPDQTDLFKYHKAALVIQRAYTRFKFRSIFKTIKEKLYSFNMDPQELLRSVNPKEAQLMEAASGNIIRFKLAGKVFPPRIEYKIFTYRPVLDVGAFSPGNYTKLSDRQKAQQAKEKPKTKPDEKEPHKRCENNGWRVYHDFCKKREDTETDTDHEIEEITFHHSKVLRQREKEREVKRRQIKWMKKMINEDQFQEKLKAMGIDDLKVDDLMQWFKKNPDDVKSWFLSEWIAWASHQSTRIQNFGEYHDAWLNSGYSKPSEKRIGPNHINYNTLEL